MVATQHIRENFREEELFQEADEDGRDGWISAGYLPAGAASWKNRTCRQYNPL